MWPGQPGAEAGGGFPTSCMRQASTGCTVRRPSTTAAGPGRYQGDPRGDRDVDVGRRKRPRPPITGAAMPMAVAGRRLIEDRRDHQMCLHLGDQAVAMVAVTDRHHRVVGGDHDHPQSFSLSGEEAWWR